MRRTGSRWLPPIAAAILVFAGLSVLRWVLEPSPPEPSDATGDLSFPEMLGCWELDVGAWEATHGVPEGTTADTGADSASRALLVPPDRVLLLPDSIDEWRRSFTTYRAVPVAGSFDPRLRGILRWFLRADTLWILWSDRSLRAGLALLPEDGRLEGAGRAVLAAGPGKGDGLDARAQAAAWKVNCATGLRDVERRGPRP